MTLVIDTGGCVDAGFERLLARFGGKIEIGIAHDHVFTHLFGQRRGAGQHGHGSSECEKGGLHGNFLRLC